MTLRPVVLAGVCVVLWVAGSPSARAQCVSLTSLSPYTQNFDTLGNTAASTTNTLTVPGWFMTETGGSVRDNEQYGVDTGASNTGDTYSYGAAASTERALGSLRTGTLISGFGACFTNNTGVTLTSLQVGYTGEEWRLGTAARTDTLAFEYSTTATSLTSPTWTAVPALNFVTPDTVTIGAKNGNAAADRTALSGTLFFTVPNGGTFWIRYTDVDATGGDDGLAVDDFTLTPVAGLPLLNINDVAQAEGNSGTTTFAFTISLSEPAGPGGVTFDVGTASNVAFAPVDFTAAVAIGVLIPAGSSSAVFNVLVNGDTTPESNEAFFVNVTNAVGALVIDGQGQATILNDDIQADVSVSLADFPDPATAGTLLDYSLVVANAGPSPAPMTSWTLTLGSATPFQGLTSPGGWTCSTPAAGSPGVVTCATGALTAGNSAAFSLQVGVAASAPSSVSNTVTVTSAAQDSNLINNDAIATTAVQAVADLSLTRDVLPSPVVAGQSLSVALTVVNNGPSDAANVLVSFPIPAGTTLESVTGDPGWTCGAAAGEATCHAPVMAPGSATVMVQLLVDPAFPLNGSVSGMATVTFAAMDPTPGNNTALISVPVNSQADLVASLLVTPDPVHLGETLTYAVSVNNLGPSAANSVTVTLLFPGVLFGDAVAPPGWSCVGATGQAECTLGMLGLGGTSLLFHGTVDPLVMDGTPRVLVSSVTVQSAANDPSPANNSASANTTATVSVDLAVTMLDTPDPVLPGGTLHDAITVLNTGAFPATGVVLAGNLAAGTTFLSLQAPPGWTCSTPAVGMGGSWSCSGTVAAASNAAFDLAVQVADTQAPGSVLASSVTVSAVELDPVTANNTATASTTVATPPAALTAKKTVDGTFTPGSQVTYLLTVTNTGSRDHADNAANEVKDVLDGALDLVDATASAGTINLQAASRTVTWDGALARGASVTLTITATLHGDAAAGATVPNQAVLMVDVDGDGTAETTVYSDDPTGVGAQDPTVFTVVAGTSSSSSGPGASSSGVDSSSAATVSSSGIDSSSGAAVSSSGVDSSSATADSSSGADSGSSSSVDPSSMGSSQGASSALSAASSTATSSSVSGGSGASSLVASSSRAGASSTAGSSRGSSGPTSSGSGAVSSATSESGLDEGGSGCACGTSSRGPDLAALAMVAGAWMVARRRRRG